jgi:hypothetical protein
MRAESNALVKHVLANSEREHIAGQELEQIAALWAACWEVPEGTVDCDAWATFRSAYRQVMGGAT